MMFEMGARYRCANEVHARRFDEEIVVVDLRRGEYFALNEVGGAIWDGLVQGLSVVEAIDRVIAEYDAPPEVIRADAERIIRELVAKGLLVAVDP